MVNMNLNYFICRKNVLKLCDILIGKIINEVCTKDVWTPFLTKFQDAEMNSNLNPFFNIPKFCFCS